MALTYIVQAGDNLYAIARRFGTTVEELVQANNIGAQDIIMVGQTLTIPGAAMEATEAIEETAEETDIRAQVIARREIRGIRYVLSTNKTVYRRGENVFITLVKTNVTNRNIILRYRTAQRFDFVVRRGRDERAVWRWSRGRVFAPVAATIILRPGASQTFRVNWNQRDNSGRLVEPGNYTIDGFNLAEGYRNEEVSANISIREVVAPTPPPPTVSPTPCPGDNILVNPSFENWPRQVSTPPGWSGRNLSRSTLSQRGNYAAELGAVPNESAVLSQRVDIEPGRIYELIWWARENVRPRGIGRFVLFVEIIYYNRAGNFAGRTEPRYSQEHIPNNAYQRYSLSTGRVPAGARTAEVRFTFEPSGNNSNTVKIDSVELRCRF